MPSSVKITDLPAISSIQRGDIIPVVDESQTQTNKATLGQVKDMQCGANSVVTSSIADAAVTAQKQGYSSNDAIMVATSAHPQSGGNSTANSDGVFQGKQITCSPYIQALLSQANGVSARAYLDALQSTNNPTFTGQVFLADGADSAPSLTNTGNADTGLFFPNTDTSGGSLSTGVQNVVGISCAAREMARFTPTGISTAIQGYAGLYPAHGSVRATANFSATGAGNVYVYNPHAQGNVIRSAINTLGSAYTSVHGTSFPPPNATIYLDPGNVNITAIKDAVEALAGGLSGTATTTIALSYGGSYTSWAPTGHGFWCTEGPWGGRWEKRCNYTSPGDNVHWTKTTGSWTATAASGKSWLGTRLQTTTATMTVHRTLNISLIEPLASNQFKFTFADSMPTDDYVVLANATGTTSIVPVAYVIDQTPTTFTIKVNQTTMNPVQVSVII